LKTPWFDVAKDSPVPVVEGRLYVAPFTHTDVPVYYLSLVVIITRHHYLFVIAVWKVAMVVAVRVFSGIHIGILAFIEVRA
jgi:hypothetical protein